MARVRGRNRQAVFTEQDGDRLYRRLRAVTGGDLSSDQLTELAGGDLSLVEDLPFTARLGVAALLKDEGGLEKMVGSTLDYVPIAYLDLARMAANSVGRVVTDGRREAVGTGTMVSTRLLLTNNHVTPDAATAGRQLVQFDYELQVDGVPKAPTEFRLDPSAFFWTSPDKELDATLVAVGPPLAGTRTAASFGMSSLTAAQDKHAEGDFVTIVQHPQGDFKQVALRENRVIGRGKAGTTLHYQGDTLPGSSGSPVFNDQFELVALHHAGGGRNEKVLEDGRPVPDESNEGIRISAIVATLRERLDEQSEPHRSLLAEALDPPSTGPRLPGGLVGPVESAGGTAVSAADVTVPVRISFGGAAPTAAPLATDNAATTATAPASSIDDGDAFTTPAPTTGGIERNQPPDPDYAKRRGYDPSFLDVAVPLPALSSKQAKDAAVPEGASKKDGLALRYVHFSVVQNAKRRMPFFTAVNIDGKRARGINRQTGEVEAAEVWFCDPRIPNEQQLTQDVFERQQPRLFDRGHLVRRLDPAWGSAETAVRAANDTFHFTNCSLQISAFNQRAAQWAGIENYVLDNAKAERKRITVFSGPVFGADDPEYRGVPVPKEFWKILVRIDGGRPRATAFLASQEEQLRKGLELESFDDLGKVEVFHTNVSTVAARTGLDFGDLPSFDTRQVEAANLRITSLDDVEW